MTTVELSGLGVTDTNEKWIPIEGLTGRQTYVRLIQTRMKIKRLRTEKSTQDNTEDTETYDSRRTELLVETDTQNDTDQEKTKQVEEDRRRRVREKHVPSLQGGGRRLGALRLRVQVDARDEQESGGPGGARSTFQQGGVEAGRGEDERKRNADGGEGKMDIPLRTMQD